MYSIKYNKSAYCRILYLVAHKMLPTLTLIGAPCTAALQALEKRRDEQEWQEADDAPAKETEETLANVIQALKAEMQ